MATIKTKIHPYCFNTNNPTEKAAYLELREKLKASVPHPMVSWSADGSGHYFTFSKMPDGMVIELETDFLFDNQWNTAPIDGFSEKGFRVFDWAEDARHRDALGNGARPNIRRGHWLEQTDEMREIRRNTNKCGYCGRNEPAAKGYVFCPHCIDSEYLKEGDLHMLRMVAIDQLHLPSDTIRPALTDAEREHLIPIYKKAQKEGATARGIARIASLRKKTADDYAKTLAEAKAKHDGALWLIDNAPWLIENWIYYSHTGRHCFGWRRKLTKEEAASAAADLAGFPADYYLETA